MPPLATTDCAQCVITPSHGPSGARYGRPPPFPEDTRLRGVKQLPRLTRCRRQSRDASPGPSAPESWVFSTTQPSRALRSKMRIRTCQAITFCPHSLMSSELGVGAGPGAAARGSAVREARGWSLCPENPGRGTARKSCARASGGRDLGAWGQLVGQVLEGTCWSLCSVRLCVTVWGRGAVEMARGPGPLFPPTANLPWCSGRLRWERRQSQQDCAHDTTEHPGGRARACRGRLRALQSLPSPLGCTLWASSGRRIACPWADGSILGTPMGVSTPGMSSWEEPMSSSSDM